MVKLMRLNTTFFLVLLLLFPGVVGYSQKRIPPPEGYFFPTPLSVEQARLGKSRITWPLYSSLSFQQPAKHDNNQATEGMSKQKGKAFIRSLLLPGAGEKYLGKKSIAKAFLITEITLWAGYFAFQKYGDWIRDDAYAFAATHSGALTEGKPSQFFVDIGNYSDTNTYNDAKQRMRQFDKVYNSEEYFWQWDEDLHRRQFENMRIASDRAINRSVFVLGGIFANHLLSAVDAVWQTHRYNKKMDQHKAKSISVNIQSNYPSCGMSLHIQKLF